MIDFRAFARSDAARALIELAPSEPNVHISRVFRRLSCSPGEAMGHLAEHLLSEIEAGRVEEAADVLAVAERFIRRARPAYLEVAVVGLLESLHAGVSHRSPASEEALVGMLPEACRRAWREIRGYFEQIAGWLTESDVAPAASGDEMRGLTDPSDTARFRSNHWRSPDGVYVGEADVLAYKLAESRP